MNLLKLALFDLRHSLLTAKGMLLLVPFTLFWLSLFYLMREGGIDFITKEYGLVASTIILDSDTAIYLFQEHPAVLSFCLLSALNTVPLFVLLGANNQTAVDAANGTFRYFLPRCTRTELFFSRMLSAFLLLSVVYCAVVVYGIILSLQIDHFTMPDTLQYGVSILFHILVYTLPFLAIMSMLSAWCSSALATMLYALIWIFCFSLITAWYGTDYPALQYLLPNHFKQPLYYVDSSELWYVYLILFAYSLLLALFGWWLFRKRDL